MTVSDFEKFRGNIINKVFAEGFQRGREVGYLEASRILQERSRTQDVAKRAPQGTTCEVKQRDASLGYSSNNHEGKHELSH